MVNMPGYKISRQNLATSEISDVMACQNCDKTFRSKFVYNFHMENTHPGIKSQHHLSDEKSQNLMDPTLKTISLKQERRTENNLTQVQSTKIIPSGRSVKKEQAGSLQDEKNEPNFPQDSAFISKLEQKLAEKKLSPTPKPAQSKIPQQESGIFNCQTCSKDFSKLKNIMQHMSRMHGETEKLECQISLNLNL